MEPVPVWSWWHCSCSTMALVLLCESTQRDSSLNIVARAIRQPTRHPISRRITQIPFDNCPARAPSRSLDLTALVESRCYICCPACWSYVTAATSNLHMSVLPLNLIPQEDSGLSSIPQGTLGSASPSCGTESVLHQPMISVSCFQVLTNWSCNLKPDNHSHLFISSSVILLDPCLGNLESAR